MRLLLTATAVALAAAVVPCTLPAQLTQIAPDRPMTMTVTEANVLPDRAGWVHRFIYDGTVTPGTTLTFHLRWITPSNSRMGALVTEAGDLLGQSEGLPIQVMQDGSSLLSRTFTGRGAFMLRVAGTGAPVGDRYTITITEGSPASFAAAPAQKYETTGLEFSAAFGPVTFASDLSTERGSGAGGRIAYNFGAVSLFGEGLVSNMSSDDGGAEDEYELTHVEGGARLFLLPSRMRFRPYAQAAYGIRRFTLPNEVQAEGAGPTFGAGAQYFLSENLSLEGAWRQSSGDIDRVRASSSDEWQDMAPEFVITGKSTRILGMFSVHF
jgi:opacity protein-like surface antigen